MPTTTLHEKLARLDESSAFSASDGPLLEQLVREHATEFPTWEIRQCWRWDEWPGRIDHGLPFKDYGIDLVAETVTGRTVAIQCKARKDRATISPSDVQKFRGAAVADVYDERWIITNAQQSPGTSQALELSGIVWKDIIDEAESVGAEAPDDETDPRTAMQDEAVQACVQALTRPQADLTAKWEADSAGVKALDGHRPIGRTKLILPCGTGKTRTAARIIDEIAGDGDVAIFLTPSISLVSQTRTAVLRQLRDAGRQVTSVVVCSDKTAGHVKENEFAAAAQDDKKTRNLETADSGQMRTSELGCAALSSGQEVADWITGNWTEDRLTLIIGTYQSAHHVAEGLREIDAAARILVCDEAHRTAQIKKQNGKSASGRLANFTCCHHQDRLPAQYRLYLTATPKVFPHDNTKVERARSKGYLVATMDDEEIFGTEGYRKSYPAAVEDDLLSDYRIIAFTTNADTWKTAGRIVEQVKKTEKATKLKITEAVRWLTYGIVLYGGTLDGGEAVDVRSSIAFLNRVDKSHALANWLTSDRGRREIIEYIKRRGLEPREINPGVKHLDANHPATERRKALRELDAATAAEPRGICNVGIFGEGTDTPSLNAVAVLDPRQSPTDVIQIVGRCMRRDPGKTTGYVIVPVTLPSDVDAETSLGMDTMDEAWKPLGQILAALRAHDGRVEDRIGDLLTICEPVEDPSEPPKKVHAPVVVKDGPVYRRGIWTGSKPGDLERTVAAVDCGKYTSERNDVREILTKRLGFKWAGDASAGDHRAPKDLTGDQTRDERLVADSGLAIAILRDRRKDPRIATFTPIGPKTDGTSDTEPTTEQRRVGIPETFAKATEKIRAKDRLRRPRRRGTESDQPDVDEPRLWKALASRNLAVEVMEKSGLRGNDKRDFNILREPLQAAAGMLRSEGLEGSLRSLLKLPEPDSQASERDRKSADACMVAAILMLNAVMIHGRLENAGSRISKLIGKNTLESVINADNPLARLAEAWVSVMTHDYKALFAPALRIVTHLRDSEREHAGRAAARRLATWARENADHYTSMNMEYAGELFARVMGEQQASGAYFTRPEAGRLLAELAANEMEIDDWTDQSNWRNLKATDLACGSGTLLNAWIETCKGRIAGGGGDEKLIRRFHRKAVEELVVGLDINPITLQMTAGRFLIGDAGLDYRSMNLFEMEYGWNDWGELRLGTLELLGEDEVIGPKPDKFKWDDDDVVDPDVKSALKDTRLIIMNPPFSRNTARNTNEDAETKRAFQQRELAMRDRVVASDEAAGNVIDANSVESFFTALADAVLPRDADNILAQVMPMTAMTGASAQKKRRMLATRFQIRYVIMSHDPKNINVSQGTDINEALLIGRRSTKSRTVEPTTFVNLLTYPTSLKEAKCVAEAIRNDDWDEIGTVCRWPAEKMRDGDWSAVQWFNPGLAEAATALTKTAKLRPAGDTYKFGPAGQRISDSFEAVTSTAEQSSDDILMFNSIEEMRRSTLVGKPDSKGRNKPPARRGHRMTEQLFVQYRASAGNILVAQRFSTTSSRTTAQFSEGPALGTAYIPLKTKSLNEAKALNLIWNSTPVLIQLLNMRTKKARYPKWSLDQLSSVRVPEVGDSTEQLAAIHDRLQNEEISRLRDAETCPVRAAIDAAVEPMFGITPDVTRDWRRLLGQEPLVLNRRLED